MAHAEVRASQHDRALVAMRRHLAEFERALARVLASEEQLTQRVEALREEATGRGVDVPDDQEQDDE